MSEQPQSPPPTGQDRPVIGLRRWERAIAGAIGLMLSGFGVLAIFVTELEVGPPVLVAIGAIFLLLATQGTAIRRADKDSVELDPRSLPGQVALEADAVLNEAGPGRAEAFIEGAAAANPNLAGSSAINAIRWEIGNASTYEFTVRHALEGMLGPTYKVLYNDFDDGSDFTIRRPIEGGRKFQSIVVEVVVKYFNSEASKEWRAITTLRRLVERHSKNFVVPRLLITNLSLNASTTDFLYQNVDSDRVPIVEWRSVADNEALLLALQEQFSGLDQIADEEMH